jgi:hypothetical protein
MLKICLWVGIASAFWAGCNEPTPGGLAFQAVPDVHGLVIYQGRAEIFRVEDGDPVGELIVNMASDTDVYSVEFCDEHGDRIETPLKDHRLDFSYGNGDYIEVEQHEGFGKWQFHVHAKKAGKTSMAVMLKNGRAETDYTSPAIPVQVVE